MRRLCPPAGEVQVGGTDWEACLGTRWLLDGLHTCEYLYVFMYVCVCVHLRVYMYVLYAHVSLSCHM